MVSGAAKKHEPNASDWTNFEEGTSPRRRCKLVGERKLRGRNFAFYEAGQLPRRRFNGRFEVTSVDEELKDGKTGNPRIRVLKD